MALPVVFQHLESSTFLLSTLRIGILTPPTTMKHNKTPKDNENRHKQVSIPQHPWIHQNHHSGYAPAITVAAGDSKGSPALP